MNHTARALMLFLAMAAAAAGQEKDATANPYLVPLAKLDSFKVEPSLRYKVEVKLVKFRKQTETSFKTDYGSSIQDEYRKRDYEVTLTGPEGAEGLLEFFFVGRDAASGDTLVYDYESIVAKPTRMGSVYNVTSGDVRSGHVKLVAIGEDTKDGLKPCGWFAWFRGGGKVIAVAESKTDLCKELTAAQRSFLDIFRTKP